MEQRLAALEVQVESLQDEVAFLRREFNRLRADQGAAQSSSGLGSFSAVTSVQGGDRGTGDSSPLIVPHSVPQLPTFASPSSTVSRAPLTPSSAAPAASGRGQPASDRVLTWVERERICDEIALWVLRALNGQHRGTSNRDQIPLASRIWVVARNFEGEDLNPVQVFSTFSACREVVKRGSELGDSVFIGLPSQREAIRVVLAAGLTWPAEGPQR